MSWDKQHAPSSPLINHSDEVAGSGGGDGHPLVLLLPGRQAGVCVGVGPEPLLELL